jgi:hypothetical protein
MTQSTHQHLLPSVDTHQHTAPGRPAQHGLHIQRRHECGGLHRATGPRFGSSLEEIQENRTTLRYNSWFGCWICQKDSEIQILTESVWVPGCRKCKEVDSLGAYWSHRLTAVSLFTLSPTVHVSCLFLQIYHRKPQRKSEMGRLPDLHLRH